MTRGPPAEPRPRPPGPDVAARWPEDRRDSYLLILRFVDDADMGGDDLPALGEPHPCLHLASDPARRGVAIKQCRGHRGIATIAGDHGVCDLAHQAGRRARRAKGGDGVIAIEIFT